MPVKHAPLLSLGRAIKMEQPRAIAHNSCLCAININLPQRNIPEYLCKRGQSERPRGYSYNHVTKGVLYYGPWST